MSSHSSSTGGVFFSSRIYKCLHKACEVHVSYNACIHHCERACEVSIGNCYSAVTIYLTLLFHSTVELIAKSIVNFTRSKGSVTILLVGDSFFRPVFRKASNYLF